MISPAIFPALLGKLCRSYLGGWKVAICYLTGSWSAHADATKEIQELFVSVPTGPTLIMNVLSYVPFMFCLNSLPGFSLEYQRFIALYCPHTNSSHGLGLLLLHLSIQHVELHRFHSSWMAQQLGHDDGHLFGLLLSDCPPLSGSSRLGEAFAQRVAGVHDLSAQHH